MQRLLIRTFLATSMLAVLASALAVFRAPIVVLAAPDPKTAVCEGVDLTGGSCDGKNATGPTVNSSVKLVINILSFVVGVAAVIMVIIGGFKYVISAGDSSNINSAKNTILYALIGLVVVALAQVIVRFVLNNVSPSGDETSHPTTMLIERNIT